MKCKIMRKNYRITFLFVLLNIYYVQSQVGINTNNPRTTLDVKGTFATAEQVIEVKSNSVAKFSPTSAQIRITGDATKNITLNLEDGPIGERIIIVNTITNGHSLQLNNFQIQNGGATQFVFSDSKWRAVSGGGGFKY